MKFTFVNMINGLAGICLSSFFLIVLPNIDICHNPAFDQKLYSPCVQTINNFGILGGILGIFLVIVGCLVPYFISIKPKDLRTQLAEESGPTHGTLPKGFDNQKEKNVFHD